MRKKPSIRFASMLLMLALPLCSCGETVVSEVPSQQTYTSSPSSQNSESAASSEVPTGSDTVPEDITATLSFAGDVLVHTPLFTSAKTDSGYDLIQFFAEMEDFFDSDFNLVNMESPVDVNGDNSGISTYPRFNAPKEITDTLEYMGVNAVTYTNNHIYDRGYDGFESTVSLLSEKFEVVGAYLNEDEYNTPQIYDVNGIKVGILAYADHINGYSEDTIREYSVRTFDVTDEDAQRIIDDADKLREAGAEYIIVYVHWGSEYLDSPTAEQKEFAYALTDGGVDVLLGGHSHCVQPIERRRIEDEDGEIREAVIIYSIGNFLADQTGLQASRGASYIKTQQGMKVTLTIKKDGETGKISLVDGTYTPTMLFREKIGSGKYNYKLLAIKQYADLDDVERSEIFFSDKDWQNCKKAYERITGIVGDDLTVT